MTVSVTPVSNFLRMSGTIAEVLDEFVNQRIITASQIAYYSDDGTNAKALVGRIA